MRLLSQEAFESASRYILNNGRYLEKLLFSHFFIEPCPEKIIKAYQMYQNRDGGYGNGLEPDFRMPYSSPMATTTALQKLSQFKHEPGVLEQVEKAIHYLVDTYNPSINGWEATSKMVNLYPHAPWWKYQEGVKNFSLNPTAEIIGYLMEFNQFASGVNVEQLKNDVIEAINTKSALEEHELYCVIRFYNRLSDIEQLLIIDKIKASYDDLVVYDPLSWDQYVPYPLKFSEIDDFELLGLSKSDLENNINYLIDKITLVGHLAPTWQWGGYLEEWEIANREWSGVLTLDALLQLDRLNALFNSYKKQ